MSGPDALEGSICSIASLTSWSDIAMFESVQAWSVWRCGGLIFASSILDCLQKWSLIK